MSAPPGASVGWRRSPGSTPSARLGGLHVLAESIAVAEAALAGGAPVIQVRTKAGTDRQRFGLVDAIVVRCRDAGAVCLVNDRVDLALAAGADGVHLGADDLPVERARTVTPPGFVVGGTARDPRTAQHLVHAGADYLGVGPVWTTTSKKGLPEPIGLDGLRAVTHAVAVPVVAISGVTAARVPETLAAGAAGVAVISAVSAAADPEAATRQLVAAFATHGEPIAKSDRGGHIARTGSDSIRPAPELFAKSDRHGHVAQTEARGSLATPLGWRPRPRVDP